MMASRPWHYLEVTFEVATRKSYKKANTVGKFTAQALTGVPTGNAALVALRDHYIPIYSAYETAYNDWKAMGGQEEGATLSLVQLEELINTDVNNWEYTVQGVYRKGTPGYKTIFPNGITDLKRGSRDERISALNAFSANLPNPALAGLKVTVDARIAQLVAADTGQDVKQTAQKLDSTAVEAARITLCTGLYYVLGGLMMQYAATPDSVAAYFDLETLRDLPQTTFSGDIAGDAIKFIVQRTLAAETEVKLDNDGDSPPPVLLRRF